MNLLSSREVAELLGVPHSAISQRISRKSRSLPKYQMVGKTAVFIEEDVVEFMVNPPVVKRGKQKAP